MILIADSGATKTDWRLQDNDRKIHQLRSNGISPFFQSMEDITNEIKQTLVPNLEADAVNEIHYYGTGCSSDENKNIIQQALQNNFKNAVIDVNHDMLGAARALCGHDAGIAAILGTGSNSCYYDGKEVLENVPSLGFVIGDDGSGAHLGKTFLKHYFEEELPKELHEMFFGTYQLTREKFLDDHYGKPYQNRYFASFVPFLLRHHNHPFISDIIHRCFRDFFQYQVCKYSRHQEVPCNFTGSIAFYFSDILKYAAKEKGITVGRIIETPIAGLTLFHLGE